jgi:hypothetical protein
VWGGAYHVLSTFVVVAFAMGGTMNDEPHQMDGKRKESLVARWKEFCFCFATKFVENENEWRRITQEETITQKGGTLEDLPRN